MGILEAVTEHLRKEGATDEQIKAALNRMFEGVDPVKNVDELFEEESK